MSEVKSPSFIIRVSNKLVSYIFGINIEKNMSESDKKGRKSTLSFRIEISGNDDKKTLYFRNTCFRA